MNAQPRSLDAMPSNQSSQVFGLSDFRQMANNLRLEWHKLVRYLFAFILLCYSIYLTQSRLGRGLYFHTKWHLDPSIQPFGHNRYWPKISGEAEAVPLWGGELCPRLTQYGQDQGVPACEVAP